jgi:NADH-quinone oxidoreductase subunit N
MQNATTPMKSVVGFAVFLTIISILLIDPLLNIISAFVSSSGF